MCVQDGEHGAQWSASGHQGHRVQASGLGVAATFQPQLVLDSSTRRARSRENGPMSFHRGTEMRFFQAVHASVGPPSVGFQDSRAAERVLEAADRFCWDDHWMMLVGDVKGKILDEAVREQVAALSSRRPHEPFVAVEFGTYVGYSAVRIARLLPSNAKLYSCDLSREVQMIAAELVKLAGVSSLVQMLQGSAQQGTDQLRKSGVKLDFVFIDHDKQDYLPALQRLETAGMLKDGAMVVADNVDVFQISDYLEYVRNSGLYLSHHVDSALEYSLSDPGGTPEVFDGVEISVFAPSQGNSRPVAEL